jgi:hypothetical protein
MAVSPALHQHRSEVLARLTQRRQAIHALVASIGESGVTLADVFARAGDGPANPLSGSDEHTDENVCRFVYVVKIAEALPGVGKVRARRVLTDLQLGERTRVGEVAMTQRAALVKELQ